MKTGKQILSNFFDTFEVDYVFGNPGTTETTFLDVVSTHERCKFILALHESVAVGLAAGYALKSGKTPIVNIHTYPGLANAMSNIFNAYAVNIPMMVIAGQQNREHLIHKPILSGELTELAKTATKLQYEIRTVSEMNVALQRCFLETTESKLPTFLSIPMEIYEDSCETGYFKKTKLLSATQNPDLTQLADELIQDIGKKIVFVVDAETHWCGKLKDSLRDLSAHLNSDVFLAPFSSTYNSIDVNMPNFRGSLPAISSQTHDMLSTYDIVVLLGEKIQSFLFHEKQSIPENIKIFQFSNGNTMLRFDCPFDYVVRGDIGENISLLSELLGCAKVAKHDLKMGPIPNTLLANIMNSIPRDTTLVIEGGSHQNIEEDLVHQLHFEEVYFKSRGGALGMAMPLAVGVSLVSQKHSVCLLGDGASMYSIQALWTAAHYNIPTIFICFVNHEYHILKQLWKLQVPDSHEKNYSTIMDISNPNLDLHKIAEGFGAKYAHATSNNYQEVLKSAFEFNGPTFITIKDDHKYSM